MNLIKSFQDTDGSKRPPLRPSEDEEESKHIETEGSLDDVVEFEKTKESYQSYQSPSPQKSNPNADIINIQI